MSEQAVVALFSDPTTLAVAKALRIDQIPNVRNFSIHFNAGEAVRVDVETFATGEMLSEISCRSFELREITEEVVDTTTMSNETFRTKQPKKP